MRLDVHTHIFHPKVAARVLAQLTSHYDIDPVGSGIADDLLARLDTAGLDAAVVHTAATEPAQVIPANNWALELLPHPRLIPFGTMHPDYPDAEAELNRLELAGIRGLKFHPDFQDFALNEPRFFRLMEMIGARFMLMIHVGDACPASQCKSSPDKLAQVRAAFPAPTIIAAHMGGWKHW
ncbi:MAG: amidohydrolase family protein, partial [Proteobacteria bacterium]|nr:amidohydrolase family protein [Pseudomonadota bacterium]